MEKKITAFTTYTFTKDDILMAFGYFYPELKGCKPYDVSFIEAPYGSGNTRISIRKES